MLLLGILRFNLEIALRLPQLYRLEAQKIVKQAVNKSCTLLGAGVDWLSLASKKKLFYK